MRWLFGGVFGIAAVLGICLSALVSSRTDAGPAVAASAAVPVSPSAPPSAGMPTPRVEVNQELVTAPAVRSVPAAPRAAKRRPSPPMRVAHSLLARLVLGSGEFRPRPFPSPGK